MKTSFVRLFDYSEIVQNFDWPEDVALAVVVRNGEIVQMHPFNDGEDPADVIEHICKLDLEEYETPLAIYPKIEGYPEIDMGFSEDIVLMSGIEAALNQPDSELREETENFVVNFQFARDMGIALPHATARPVIESSDNFPSDNLLKNHASAVTPDAQKTLKNNVSTLPDGFISYGDLVTVPAHIESATFSRPEPGIAYLTFAGDGPTATLSEKDILIRTDRTGFAIPAKACMVNGLPASSITLPFALMPDALTPLGLTVKPIVSRTADLVFFTFVGAPPISKAHKVMMGVFAAYFVVTMSIFGGWASDRTIQSDNPAGAIGALRNELFK